MKSAAKALALFALFATLAHAQSVPSQFKHVIIVVQENRTPDNLFAGVPPQNGWAGPWFENGVDLKIAPTPPGGQPAQPWCLGSCFDPNHGQSAWQNQFANGLPTQTNPPKCGSPPPPNGTGLVTYCSNVLSDVTQPRPVCGQDNSNHAWAGCSQSNPINVPTYPEESYVSYTYDSISDQTGTQHVLDPYISIATQYGFANYFYQTNQGPSEPAHDFLFGGTSAPTGDPTKQYYNYFAANNPHTSPVGCEGSETLPGITPDGNFGDSQYPGVNLNPCFDHQTLTDLLEAHGLTWKYYTATPNGIWTAPNAIQHICLQTGTPPPNTCNNSKFTSNVLHPNKFFQDFPSGGSSVVNGPTCTLPSVAWIIPDGLNSDHAGFKNDNVQVHSTDIEGGPNWVASVINSVGNAKCTEPDGTNPWLDTVIFVVWDDWGGWYDHVMGTNLYEPNDPQFHLPCFPQYNNLSWGCGYTYGFRVPFLVVSAYTKDRTVSGFCTQGVDCVSNGNGSQNTDPHRHDFGSILAFIEYNFNLTLGGINLNNGFPFADYYAPELQHDRAHGVPLSDFFNLTQAKNFEPIATVSNSFTFDYFYNFNGPFTDPDDDAIDPQN